ncbi:hypothetical protein CEXT_553751 [Caerostris extrusa]|uniref:Uncharacterized protein n=1 Tax=Caerostris extrusa TaxID=172846 RepID=A0AAV4PV14_CAEEX|nr:hypothetical protein CEXT_553751 [Caerostris extrusa]
MDNSRLNIEEYEAPISNVSIHQAAYPTPTHHRHLPTVQGQQQHQEAKYFYCYNIWLSIADVTHSPFWGHLPSTFSVARSSSHYTTVQRETSEDASSAGQTGPLAHDHWQLMAQPRGTGRTLAFHFLP